MITVGIFGGLGNQMFQYALGRHLSLKNKDSLTLRHIDVGAFSKRDYVLGCFKLSPEARVKSEVRSQKSKFKAILEGLFSFSTPGNLVQEKSFRFDPDILELKGDVHLHGYWQSEKYFKDVREIILEDFTPIRPLSRRNQRTLEEIERSNSVSVHVRRGDYVVDQKTNKFHGVCGLEYYKKAVDLITKRVKNPIFYFFSDDIGWVKKNLSPEYLSLSTKRSKSVYVDWNTGAQSFVDMQLMSHCKHNILANSSFSWWGAWLNRNPEKIVVAPARWFQDKSVDTRDLIPSEWLMVNS